jgi:hypothetical protein
MACRNTFTKRNPQAAFTVVEMLMATGLGALIATALVTMLIFAMRSFAAMTNYTDMQMASRLALDEMAKEVRQTRSVSAWTTNSVSLIDSSGNTVQYVYNPTAQTLSYIAGGQTNVYLTNCSSLTFYIYQNTVISNTFDAYAPAFVSNARLLQVTWTCYRQIMSTAANTECVQSAEIVLRNR